MGHLVGKEIYRTLGRRLDDTAVRLPWNQALLPLLEALYSPKEAAFICRLPERPSTLHRLQAIYGQSPAQLKQQLTALCAKGLVCDLWDGQAMRYAVSPFVIGFYEFTMMRTQGPLLTKAWAELFHAYLFASDDFFAANFADGQQVSIMRALPWAESVAAKEQVEILDYEKAQQILFEQKNFAIGLCSCRHEKMHLEQKKCDVPLESCTSVGPAATFLVRNGLARTSCRSEMIDLLQQSKEKGLILSTENVQQSPGFICHCCPCCCNLTQGIKATGYPGILVSSNYLAHCDQTRCNGCGLCLSACPIDAMGWAGDKAAVDETLCVGCGVCALKCPQRALELRGRKQKVFHPADSFERVILQALERGTLQNLIFDNPNRTSQLFLRSVLGGFLRLPPVKKALMKDRLRSRFLGVLRRG